MVLTKILYFSCRTLTLGHTIGYACVDSHLKSPPPPLRCSEYNSTVWAKQAPTPFPPGFGGLLASFLPDIGLIWEVRRWWCWTGSCQSDWALGSEGWERILTDLIPQFSSCVLQYALLIVPEKLHCECPSLLQSISPSRCSQRTIDNIDDVIRRKPSAPGLS